MEKQKQDAGAQITAVRASRLYRLLTMLGNGRQPRETLLRRLKIDLRGYYRDLELLRSLGITVCVHGTRYQLLDPLDSALARLPFPDPRLNVRDALLLARGSTDAHRRFRRQLDTMLGPAQRDKCDGGPRWNEEA
jgi:hypothetical protein